MGYAKVSDILEECEKTNKEFWEVILEEDCHQRNVTKEDSFENMNHLYQVMKKADMTYDSALHSASGMAGGDGGKFEQYRKGFDKKQDESLIGTYLGLVIEKAIKMGESNACMRRIVAMPTAGSCGVIPAVLLSYQEFRCVSDEEMIKALYVAGGIGEVIAASASISGAEGGCQAEIGSASAMAAGALAFLEGANNDMIINAMTLAIKNMLGLTCDPVAGLVEVPCIKRNVAGATNAVHTSQMALAGIKSAIPADETIDAMKRIGKLIPSCLRETGEEGLATSATGKIISKSLS